MIISSLLDTDLYKLTMMQLVFHRFAEVTVSYQFICRTENVDLLPYADEINHEIDQLCQLRFTADEINYLSKLNFFQKDYLEFLKNFQLRREHIEITQTDHFNLSIKGPWLNTILFEVPLLAIISRVYYRKNHAQTQYEIGQERLAKKIQLVKSQTPDGEFKFSDFGTRRRFSRAWQEEVLRTLQQELPDNLKGTSNVYFAKKFNLTPIGTMAHEYIQAFQVLAPTLIDSQKQAFKTWLEEYKDQHGVVLADTYGIKAFFRDFDKHFANQYQGVRQDSGDPILWGEQLIKHYENFHIDPLTKILVFSDALTFEKAIELFWHFKSRINVAFGIGTNLTNDLGHEPIQIVVKMIECQGKPVAKISDSPGKTMHQDPAYLEYLKKIFTVE